MVGSWLDYAAGIRIRGNGRCNYRVSSIQTTAGNHMLNGLGEGHCTDLPLVYPKAFGGFGGQGDRIGQLDEGAVIREQY